MPADKLVDSIFRALSSTNGNSGKNDNTGGGNDNTGGGNNVQGAVDGGDGTRAALKGLVRRPAHLCSPVDVSPSNRYVVAAMCGMRIVVNACELTFCGRTTPNPSLS